MRKYLCISAALFAISALAAPPVFDVKSPGWQKVVVPSTDGLNIRKAPSSTAPKLMYDENDIIGYDIPVISYAKWVSTPRKSMTAIPFDTPAPLASEKEGWFEVVNVGPCFKENGWVSSKYSKAADIQKFDVSALPSSRNAWINRGDQGVYMVNLLYNEMDGDATFRVGRLIDGVVVAPYEFYCPVVNFDPSKKPSLKKNGDYFEFTYNSSVSADDFEYDPLASKLSAELLEEIIKNATPADPVVYYQYDGQIYELPL